MSRKNRKMLKINFLNFAIRLILRLVFNVALHSITRILDRAKDNNAFWEKVFNWGVYPSLHPCA